MDLNININLDNSAFKDENEHLDKKSIQEILKWIGHNIADNVMLADSVRDINGSVVGSYQIRD